MSTLLQPALPKALLSGKRNSRGVLAVALAAEQPSATLPCSAACGGGRAHRSHCAEPGHIEAAAHRLLDHPVSAVPPHRDHPPGAPEGQGCERDQARPMGDPRQAVIDVLWRMVASSVVVLRVCDGGQGQAADQCGVVLDKPVDLQHSLVAVAVFFFHVVVALSVARLSWRAGGGLLQHLLQPATLQARSFAAVPEHARTHETKCTICLVEFSDEDAVFALPCRHVFHPDCLSQWLLQAEACPLAAAPLALGQEDEEAPQTDPDAESANPADDMPSDTEDDRGDPVAVVLGRVSI
eukprot:CAMPEP_0171204248 /NCGR_PEP_ID=MMETSP0790-20130122/25943_1 /TAXON_ID=2925 /ORGANISM="Alexandrium catenella, Strain OF101" /LENGTH=294 /DNA_ID=CAMNT_0011669743 /DNA_START=66 /DNA_END=951 /DNA_ORIENTATION=-